MKNLFFAFVFIFASVSQAAIVCQGQSPAGAVKVELDKNIAVVSGAALQKPQTYQVSEIYDGHMTALATAPGFSMSYQDWYGCIHNATITTNFRDNSSDTGLIGTIQISQCTGGSSPDNICIPE